MKKILVATDGSPLSLKACTWALDLAKLHAVQGCQVLLANIAPLSLLDLATFRAPMSGEDLLPKQLQERLAENSQAILKMSQEHLKDTHGVQISTHSVLGHPADVICELAKEEQVDLIVVGSCGHSKISRILLGSVSDSIVNHAHCPVLVVKDPDCG